MKKDATRSGLRYLMVLLVLLLPVAMSWASVTIVGSRIIYPSTIPSVDVQLKNNDDFPYVVQTWFDNGDMRIGPENASGIPFIATPPVFRIQPKAGQVVRVVYSQSKALPNDRESVFWFNALQVPPANIGGRQQNKVLVMLRTRIKLFYRPEGIGSPGNLAKSCTLPWCVMPEKVPVLSSATRSHGMRPQQPERDGKWCITSAQCRNDSTFLQPYFLDTWEIQRQLA